MWISARTDEPTESPNPEPNQEPNHGAAKRRNGETSTRTSPEPSSTFHRGRSSTWPPLARANAPTSTWPTVSHLAGNGTHGRAKYEMGEYQGTVTLLAVIRRLDYVV